MACSAARSAISLGIAATATLGAEEAATEVEDTVEEVTEEVQAVEEAEVCPSSLLKGLARSLSFLRLSFWILTLRYA